MLSVNWYRTLYFDQTWRGITHPWGWPEWCPGPGRPGSSGEQSTASLRANVHGSQTPEKQKSMHIFIRQFFFFLDKHNNTDLLSRNSAVPPAEWEAESRVRSPEWTFRWTGLPGRPPASGRSHLRRRSKVEISNIPDEHAAGVVSLVRVSPVGLLKAISLSFTAVITG